MASVPRALAYTSVKPASVDGDALVGVIVWPTVGAVPIVVLVDRCRQ